MTWPIELALGLIKTVWALRPTKPSWRWGHGYPGNELDNRCIYCDSNSAFRQRVTSPTCSGPSKARADEIKAAGGARFFRARA